MKTLLKSATQVEPEGLVVVKSDDELVSYRLQPTQLGLCVQRERRRAREHTRLVQTAVFEDRACFLRWCEADSVRFDYPIVFAALTREGTALLESQEPTTSAACDHERR